MNLRAEAREWYLMLDAQWHYLSCWKHKNYRFIDAGLFFNQRILTWRVTLGMFLRFFEPPVFPLYNEDDEDPWLECGSLNELVHGKPCGQPLEHSKDS